MRKRILSLLLALVLVLGLVPAQASADEVPSVDVIMSLSYDDQYMEGQDTGEVMALLPITVPYFDLALYGLEEYYFSSQSYGDDGDGRPGSNLEPGTAESAYGHVTMMHVNIFLTEVYYCGLNPAEAGQGYLYEAGLLKTGKSYSEEDYENSLLIVSGTVGSSYLEKFWDYSCNLNYYVNYEFPLASAGWGATADQILVEDGDIITLGGFSSWNMLSDSAYGFNYIAAESATVSRGEMVELTVMRASEDLTAPGTTAQNPVDSCPEVFYCLVDDMPSKNVAEWTSLGYADGAGNITLDTSSLEAGKYMVAIPGQYGVDNDASNIVSTPGGMLLTVVGDEPEAPPVNYGDVNGDSSVDASDVSLVAQYVANLYKDIDTAAADVDNSGSIDASDVSLIAQYVAHLLDALPVGSANS